MKPKAELGTMKTKLDLDLNNNSELENQYLGSTGELSVNICIGMNKLLRSLLYTCKIKLRLFINIVWNILT